MPPNGCPFEPARLLVCKQQAELESFGKTDVLELRGRREGFSDIAGDRGHGGSACKASPARSRTDVRTPVKIRSKSL